ncbi:hypothetical protein L9F63_022042, partial [Diploptera punctata]
LYMQELNKQREMLYTVELVCSPHFTHSLAVCFGERERRRQHMVLVKALESRKRLEERERKRQEMRAEKMASKERRMEQRRIELELIRELRKPIEDMEISEQKVLPTLNRIPGLKLSGQAFADTLMVFEFLHNFGETLGFDMESLPSLNSLQMALLNDEEAEEELLSVMTHLLVCAIEDPGIPNPARHTTILGQSLKQADITHSNLSEILRIYLYANATGEVKALTGIHFERDREKKSDHHNNYGEAPPSCGKNAAFFEHLHDNPTWKMSEWLHERPFLALNPTHKAAILAFLCNELLQNKAVIRQIDNSIETVGQLRKDRWILDTKIRKLRMLHGRKIRQSSDAVGVDSKVKDVDVDDDDDDADDAVSGNESEGTQPEEDEDKNLSAEELNRKVERLMRQTDNTLQGLSTSAQQLRAICFGQDRYWRRYWSLPCAGGVFVEAMESADPDAYSDSSKHEKEEKEMKDADEMQKLSVEDRLKDDTDMDESENEKPKLILNIEALEKDAEYDDKERVEMEVEHRVGMEMDISSNKTDTEQMDENTRDEKIKSDLFSSELNAVKKEDKGIGTSSTTFLVHRPIQFERLGECMEKANSEFEFVDTTAAMNNEKNWFSILPRDACDSTSVTNGTCPSRCVEGGTELRIPVFPPPSRLSSPSPGGSQCDSPAPLILTAEEMVQLEQIKKTGPIEPGELKPIPCELRRGWWRITDEDQLKIVLETIHSRGVRERELKRVLSRYIEHSLESSSKLCVAAGDKSATDLAITDMDSKISALPGGAPLRDSPSDWFTDVALRCDVMLLEQVEALEDKVANASMQVKGWKVPARVTTDENINFRPSCLPAHGEYANTRNPIEIAKDRLMSLEAAIERRYLKPPLGVSTGDVNLSGMSGEVATTEDNVPKGLVTWREAVGRAHTSAQLAMALYMLEASIAWDKSIMKANCQFCHSGDNEDKLLLCDGCDKGYHTYCFKPKMDNIPDGDWYCYECMNKATGERNCIVCGKKVGKNLVTCDLCPRAYHTDCLQPPLSKVPRGKWYCPTCQTKQPKKRNSGRRSGTHTKPKDFENSDQPPPATSPATPLMNTEDSNSAIIPSAASPSVPSSAPTTPNKKERVKKMSKDLNPCKLLLEDLETHDEAWPFLLPVNTKQFPTYRKIIKTPMDLSTIKKKLQDCQYKNREEFCADVRLIFNNCETFNEDDSPVGKAGHSMRSFFETRWSELCTNHPKNNPSNPPA